MIALLCPGCRSTYLLLRRLDAQVVLAPGGAPPHLGTCPTVVNPILFGGVRVETYHLPPGVTERDLEP